MLILSICCMKSWQLFFSHTRTHAHTHAHARSFLFLISMQKKSEYKITVLVLTLAFVKQRLIQHAIFCMRFLMRPILAPERENCRFRARMQLERNSSFTDDNKGDSASHVPWLRSWCTDLIYTWFFRCHYINFLPYSLFFCSEIV